MRLQHGFSLVEVLVTLLILKVGLLGVLAAQTFSLRQLQDAIQRTQAIALSHGLLSEVRANPRLVAVLGPQITRQSELPSDPTCNFDHACTADQVAATQLNSWAHSLQTSAGTSLLNPAFCLQQQAGALQLAVSWHQRGIISAAVPGCEAATGRSAFVIQGGGQ